MSYVAAQYTPVWRKAWADGSAAPAGPGTTTIASLVYGSVENGPGEIGSPSPGAAREEVWMRSTSLTWTLTLLAVRALVRVVDLAGPTRLRLRVHVLSARLHRASLDRRSHARRGHPGTIAGVAVAVRQLFHEVSTLFTGH